MAERYNSTCSICGKPYYKCVSCKDALRLHPWQVRTCSSGHYQVSQVVKGFSTGVYTKEEAREKFKNVNIEDIETFKPNIRDIIKDIIKEDKKVKPIVEPIVDVESDKDIVEVNVKNPVYSRKKNLKVEESSFETSDLSV